VSRRRVLYRAPKTVFVETARDMPSSLTRNVLYILAPTQFVHPALPLASSSSL